VRVGDSEIVCVRVFVGVADMCGCQRDKMRSRTHNDQVNEMSA